MISFMEVLNLVIVNVEVSNDWHNQNDRMQLVAHYGFDSIASISEWVDMIDNRSCLHRLR